MTGIERMKRTYEGNYNDIAVYLFFSIDYMCLHSGVPEYRFLYGPHEYRAEAMIAITKLHDLDSFNVWNRGKRKDWQEDYQLVENRDEIYIWDAIEKRKLKLSKDYYAIDFPEEMPYRLPYIQYGETQELINSKPTCSQPKFNIQTKEDVDRLLPLELVEQAKEGGMFEGVRLVSKEIGKDVFIESTSNSSFRYTLGLLGFQEGLMFMHDQPEVFRYLLDRVMRQELEYLKVIASYGVRSTIIGDLWVDLISKEDYQKYVLPIAIAFVNEARKLGLKAHYYMTGKVAHLLDYVNEIKPDAFHLEEYAGIDIADVRSKLNKDIVLYGDIDAFKILEKGPVSAIEKESKNQIQKCMSKGPFVLGLGSIVTKNTPPEHIDAMIRVAHSIQ